MEISEKNLKTGLRCTATKGFFETVQKIIKIVDNHFFEIVAFAKKFACIQKIPTVY